MSPLFTLFLPFVLHLSSRVCRILLRSRTSFCLFSPVCHIRKYFGSTRKQRQDMVIKSHQLTWYNITIKEKSKWEKTEESRAIDDAWYDRPRSYRRSYQTPPPPPSTVYHPCAIGLEIRRPQPPETTSEHRTQASGRHPERESARRTSPSPSPRARRDRHQPSPSSSSSPSHLHYVVIMNPSGSLRVLLWFIMHVCHRYSYDACYLHVWVIPLVLGDMDEP